MEIPGIVIYFFSVLLVFIWPINVYKMVSIPIVSIAYGQKNRYILHVFGYLYRCYTSLNMLVNNDPNFNLFNAKKM